jgi:hypothetical protein
MKISKILKYFGKRKLNLNNYHEYTQVDKTSQIFEDIVYKRRSVMKFQNKQIPDEDLKKVLTLTQRSPSSFNLQTWKAIIVQEVGNIKKLSSSAISFTNQQRILV